MGTRVLVEGAFSRQRLGLGWKPPGDVAVQSGCVPRLGLPLPHSSLARGPVRQQHSPHECSQRGLPGPWWAARVPVEVWGYIFGSAAWVKCKRGAYSP